MIAPGLTILFCGINPSLYSGATGNHFAGPGNRFWKALHGSGLTARELSAFENRDLLRLRLGVTNLVERATRSADELSSSDFREGGRRLEGKVRRHRPEHVAVLGLGAYKRAFGRRRIAVGLQPEDLAGAKLWVLPNPSGLNTHFPLAALIEEFSGLRAEAMR